MNSFRKLKFARDAYDPFATAEAFSPAIPTSRNGWRRRAGPALRRSRTTRCSDGLRRNGALVATLRFDVQRLFRNELDVIATLSTTAELGDDDNVNTLDVRVDGRRLRLRERTAERIFPAMTSRPSSATTTPAASSRARSKGSI